MSDQGHDPQHPRPDDPPGPGQSGPVPPPAGADAAPAGAEQSPAGAPPSWRQSDPENGPYGGDAAMAPPPSGTSPSWPQSDPQSGPYGGDAAMAPPPPAPLPGGLTPGDPLGGLATGVPPVPPGGTYPAGYTTTPPPGAGGPPAHWEGARPAPGTYVLAGWGSRVGAAVIDGIIVGIIALVLSVPLGVGIFSSGDEGRGGLALFLGFIATLLVFAVVALAYAPLMMARTNGKTVGRMATGIRVIRANGRPITFGFAALREVAVKALLVGAVSSFTFGLAWLIDVLWPLWDSENRALHDFVVDTRTIRG